jgi:hypothetical protein
MKNKALFITQAKGGSGKSVLAFMLAEKYKHAKILDLDDATTTSIKQLAYRNPIKVSFLDETTKRIDRGAFNQLFESIANSNAELFIVDLGASVAEQLPKYFSVTGIEAIAELLRSSEIDLQLICVVGGGNIFKATMEYLSELVDSTKGQFQIVVAANGLHPMSSVQGDILNTYVANNRLTLQQFDIAVDKGEHAMRTIENVLQKGNGLEGLNPFQLVYFMKGMENLNI